MKVMRIKVFKKVNEKRIKPSVSQAQSWWHKSFVL